MFPYYYNRDSPYNVNYQLPQPKRLLYDNGVENSLRKQEINKRKYIFNKNQINNKTKCRYTDIINIKNQKEYFNPKYISTENKLFNMNQNITKYPITKPKINNQKYYNNQKKMSNCNDFLLSTPTRINDPPFLNRNSPNERFIDICGNQKKIQNTILKNVNNSSRDIAITKYLEDRKNKIF